MKAKTTFRGLAVLTAASAMIAAVQAGTIRMNADVVVIGAGAAGTAAALASQQSGAKTVLLEKTAFQMGAGSFAGGMFAAESSQQAAQGRSVDKKWLFDQYMELSGGFADANLVRRIIDESGPTVDWLNENGADLKLVSAGTGFAFSHIGMPATLHGYQKGGAKALQALLTGFKQAGGKVCFSTPATELIRDESGRIVGVSAKQKGDTLEISARSVVIATGGFGGNPDMMKQFIGEPYTPGEIAQNTGDGIRMAWKAGAGRRGENVAQYFWQTFSKDETAKLVEQLGDKWFGMTSFSMYPFLRVNLNGERFSDETKSTLFSVHGAALHMQPEETEFMIVDDQALAAIAQKGTAGIEEHFAAFKDKPEFFMEFNEPNDTAELYKAEHEPIDYRPMLDKLVGATQTVYKGGTIEELAQRMGVDPKAMSEAVAQYNHAAKTGRDDLFFADAKRLIPVQKGPFYAIRSVARNLGTLGGIRINKQMQVLNAKGRVIPGLWAAGADAGGMYGKAYVDFEGGTLGFAYTSGRLAGIDAARHALKP